MLDVKLGNVEIVDISGKKMWRCVKCDCILCPSTEDYKDASLKNTAPISKGQPYFLASKSAKYILKEYYCPDCATMFTVDMVVNNEKRIRSPQVGVD